MVDLSEGLEFMESQKVVRSPLEIIAVPIYVKVSRTRPVCPPLKV